MGRIRKLIGLPSDQRRLLFKAVALLATVRLVLWLLPFPAARRLIDVTSRPSQRLVAEATAVERLVWAVEMASRVVPRGGHCLSKAVAAKILLMRRGHEAEIRYGAVKEDSDQFVAHAWLEHEGQVIVGGHDLNRYAMLTPRADSRR